MKVRVLLLIFGLLLIWILFLSNSFGRAEVGFGNTGAPGDAEGCFVSSCHTDTDAFGNETIIEVFQEGSNIPVTAYQPDVTYDLLLSILTDSMPGGYGFQMVSLLDSDSSDVASFSDPGEDVQIMTASSTGRLYAEHSQRSETNTFQVKWTAPAPGSGNLTFYASGNAVNGNGFFTGDDPDTTHLHLPEGDPLGFGILELSAFSISPNPVGNLLNLSFSSTDAGEYDLYIRDVLGRSLINRRIRSAGIESSFAFDLSLLENGFYYLVLTQNNRIRSEPFVISR